MADWIARLCELLTKSSNIFFIELHTFKSYRTSQSRICYVHRIIQSELRNNSLHGAKSGHRPRLQVWTVFQKWCDTYNVFCTFHAKEFLMCILKYSLKSPKSSKNLCILETMLCQQNQSKLKYFMCNYDKDLKYIFNMI